MQMRMNGRMPHHRRQPRHRARHRQELRQRRRQRRHRRPQPGPLDKAKADIAAQANVKVVTVAADVGSADGCRKAYRSASSALGQIDVLVNNAGTSRRGPFIEITDELWQTTSTSSCSPPSGCAARPSPA